MKPESLKDFLARERSAGSFSSSGLFTLSLKAAQKKLAESRLPNPGFWLLKIVQAAVASGANYVQIRLSRTRTRITFDGPGEDLGGPGEVASNLFALADLKRSSHRHLVLGICAASGLPFKHRLLWRDSRHQRQLSISGDTVRVDQSECEGFTLVLEQRLGWFGRPFDRAQYHQMLHQRCRHAPIPVLFDGRDLTREHTPPTGNEDLTLVEAHTLGEPGLRSPAPGADYQRSRGALHWMPKPSDRRWVKATPPLVYLLDSNPPKEEGILNSSQVVSIKELARPGRLIAVKDGVDMDPVFLDSPGFEVLLPADGLTLDASDFAVVQNQAWSALTADLDSKLGLALRAVDSGTIDRLFRHRIQASQRSGEFSNIARLRERHARLEGRVKALRRHHFG